MVTGSVRVSAHRRYSAAVAKPDLHPARRLGENEADARRRLLDAAERCVERHGIRKTTMEDIAREAGISRPSVYRYFSDREELLLAVMSQHSRALVKKTHRFIARQSTFADAIVEGLLYLADHGRRDVITRHLVDSNDSAFSNRLDSTQIQETLTAEFWSDFLQAAQAGGDMIPTLDLAEVHHWLAHVGLMLMSLMDRAPDQKDRHRRMIETFVLPGLLAAPAPAQG
jgi:AcrR family transcriptional regulator